jgi:hypothetical protein
MIMVNLEGRMQLCAMLPRPLSERVEAPFFGFLHPGQVPIRELVQRK